MHKKHILLFLIIVLGFLIRAYKIDSLPLYGDELTIVYDSYSILKTGKDSVGESFPLTFTMGAGRPGGYVYASIPFVAAFGLGALGVRALSLLSGVGIIFVVYLLSKKLFSHKVALFTSFLVTVSPIAISLSRAGFEANFAVFLAVLGTYFFLLAQEKSKFIIFWALCWGLTIHTYPTFKLVLPIFLVILFYFVSSLKSVVKSKNFLVAVLLLCLFSFFSLKQTFSGRSEARFLSINLFSDSEIQAKIVEKINYERSISALPVSLSKYFYNKPVEYAKLYFENYSKNFSLDYLLIKGDGNPRHNPAEVGIIFIVEILTIGIGIISMAKQNRKTLLLLIFWVFSVPLATALISDPHNLRNAFIFIPLAILSGYGLAQVNKKFLLAFTFLIFLQLAFILQRIYFLAPQKFAGFWAENAKVASLLAGEKLQTNKYVLLSDRIDNVEFAYPVYQNIDPREVISQNRKRNIFQGQEFKQLGNVFIGRPNPNFFDNLSNENLNIIYIGDISESKNFSDFETLKSSDNSGGIIVKSYK